MGWTRALHFKSWAQTQDARHTLPLLLRRLVRAMAPPNASVIFPAHEQVQGPGVDGKVEVAAGNQFIPTGTSAWEMGVTDKIKEKADDDFEKRTTRTPVDEQRKTTFVFVTPREWRNKRKWANEMKQRSEWKDVIALDANDLEHWIELCPAVDLWFSTTCGLRPDGLLDLHVRWKSLSQIAAHCLRPQIFLTSRDQTCMDLLNWLDAQPSSLFLKSDNAEDGLDFLAALTVAHLKDNPHLERMFVVNDINVWRKLSISREPLILVAAPSLPLRAEDIAEAVTSGHHVLLTGNRGASPLATTLGLPRQESFAIRSELQHCGFDDSTARSLALSCCGSSSVLKRLLTQHPQTVFPEWAMDAVRISLAPFALLGGWVHIDPEAKKLGIGRHDNPIDLMCIEDFMGIDRETVEATVTRWCGTDEPLFLRFRDHIVIGSREDAWYLLASAITPQMLARFEDLASLVLDEDHPALDLDSNDRWMANIYGKTHSLSGEMRTGILESLVLMAVYPIANQTAMNVDYPATVLRILKRALPEHASWKRWATFDKHLQLFAEASPEFLLSRVEADLNSDLPQIPKLFQNAGDGLFSSSVHCGLLWALETMAWNPSLLPRVTEVLARLVEIEQSLPKNMGNRPSSTLNSIYLWWMPHTNATVEERAGVLRRLINSYPAVAWPLLIEMLPTNRSSFCDPTEMPRWRNWAVGWSRRKPQREIDDYGQHIVSFIIDIAANSPQKWAEALSGILYCGERASSLALNSLKHIAEKCKDLNGRSVLWKSLRELINHHTSSPDADWSFDQGLLQQLQSICDQLQPDDPVTLNEWLFDHHPDFARPDLADSSSPDWYDRYSAEIQVQRVVALRQIVAKEGWDGVARLVIAVPDVGSVGWLIATNQLLSLDDINLWSLIDSENLHIRQFVAAYVAGAFQASRVAFLERLRLEDRSAQQAAKVMCSLPFERATWDWIESNLDQAFCDEYWRLCRGMVQGTRTEDLRFAIERLLKARRPFTAIHILGMALHDSLIDKDLVCRALEAGLSSDDDQEGTDKLHVYSVQQLIRYLQQHSRDQLARLAALEWNYLPILARHSSEVEPLTLINELRVNPSWFVDLVKIVYRSANEQSQSTPHDRIRTESVETCQQAS